MKSSPSLVGRAVLAVFLMLGFYLLALVVAGLLLYVPYAEWVYAHRIHVKLALVCGVGGLLILWSILPRLDRFEPPGPRLTAADQPRLFREIEGVATAVGQAMPVEVYLVQDVNAWVAQRGGVMGFGSRRVMGLGLPLMRTLTVSEFRAVLAHEFGHYHGGDTKLGPWVYKTRGAIGRTIQALAGEGGEGGLLQLPFLAYGRMFLRVTHAVSRRQEFVADALAAQSVGAKPLTDGLRRVHAVGAAFPAYFQGEVVPVLSAGFRPPMTEGFMQFLAQPQVAEKVTQGLQEALQSGKADPYDTHPPLSERIAAVQDLPAGESPAEDPPATWLLEGIETLERQLLASLAGEAEVVKLRPIGWEEVPREVYQPQWEKLVAANAGPLSALRMGDLSVAAAKGSDFDLSFVALDGKHPGEGEAARLAGAVVGAAIALALVQVGWTVHAAPGEGFILRRGAGDLEPFGLLPALRSGQRTAEEWSAFCHQWGLTGITLASASKD